MMRYLNRILIAAVSAFALAASALASQIYTCSSTFSSGANGEPTTPIFSQAPGITSLQLNMATHSLIVNNTTYPLSNSAVTVPNVAYNVNNESGTANAVLTYTPANISNIWTPTCSATMGPLGLLVYPNTTNPSTATVVCSKIGQCSATLDNTTVESDQFSCTYRPQITLTIQLSASSITQVAGCQ